MDRAEPHPPARRSQEVFDAELLAPFDGRNEGGQDYTILSGSAATISCAQSDDARPGQHFAIATGEVCRSLLSRDNTLTLQSVPSHEGIEGVVEAAENVEDSVARGCLRETRSSVRGDC